jgi:hypothetical protein
MKKIFLSFVFYTLPSLAFAYGGLTNGILISANFTAINQNTELETSSKTNTSLNYSIMDSKLGYITEGGWYMGAIYHTRTQSDASNTDRANESGLSFGLTFPEGFYIMAHYFIDGKMNDGSSQVEYKKGSGYGTDFGYLTDISTSLYIGVCYSWRTLKYTERAPTSTSFQTFSLTEQSPLFSLALLF